MEKCRETGILLLGEETKPQKSKQVNKQKGFGGLWSSSTLGNVYVYNNFNRLGNV
jgi:hypothetical protein